MTTRTPPLSEMILNKRKWRVGGLAMADGMTFYGRGLCMVMGTTILPLSEIRLILRLGHSTADAHRADELLQPCLDAVCGGDFMELLMIVRRYCTVSCGQRSR